MKILVLPRETKELIPVEVTVDRVSTTAGVRFDIVATGQRPATWINATVVGAQALVQIESLTPGEYMIYAQVTRGAEVAVIEAGVLLIT